MAATTTTGGQVGRSLPRLEGREKVTGGAEYTHLMQLPGMLHAKIFRSTVAHGRITSIDTAAARAIPGVYAVYTGEDVRKVIPDPYYGPAFHDQPILALNKVHYVGEPVAVVLAADPHVAEQAAQEIAAEYQELPAVFDEVEAAENKILVHEELKPAGTFADLKHLKGRKGTNIALDFRLRRGNVEKAFASAAHVFEHTFRTQKVLHVPFEPFASIADYRDDGVTIYTASQSPSFVRTEIARLLGWPENRVRVKVPYLGGGYGAKLYIKMEALAVALSMLARRPVKVALTMEELFYTITKHPSTFRIKSGVDKDGRIIARECEVWWNGGAYADIGPRVTQKSGFSAAGPYDIDNVSIDSYALYTNLTPAGALRGFGIPQLVWAYESHTDMIARALKRDPLEFRKQNLLRNGRPQATGTILKDAAIEKVLDRIAERLNWKGPFDHGQGVIRRGRGLAVAFKAVISPTTSVANVIVSADGSATLYCGTVDMGQGSDTAMAQMVGEVLNMPAETVRIVPRDTDVTPYDMGTLGSRSLFHMGHAVRLAAEDAKAKLAALAREVGEPEGSNIPLRELFLKKYGMQAGNVVGTGTYKPDYIPPNAEGHDGERDAVLDGGRRRRRDRSRYRNRPCASDPADQRRRRRPADQSEDRRDAIVGRLADAARLQPVREDAYRRRPGHQCFARRLQDPGHFRRAACHGKRGGRRLSEQRSVRRQGRRRGRDLRRVAGNCQCHRRRRRRPLDRIAVDAGSGLARAARQRRPPAGRRMR